jgi:transcriptional regulator with XRE-family HTH domain
MSAVDLNARLASNLRRIRSTACLSQEALAALAKLHRTYIGGVERGERKVTLRTVEKIAAALDVDPLDLLKEPPVE